MKVILPYISRLTTLHLCVSISPSPHLSTANLPSTPSLLNSSTPSLTHSKPSLSHNQTISNPTIKQFPNPHTLSFNFPIAVLIDYITDALSLSPNLLDASRKFPFIHSKVTSSQILCLLGSLFARESEIIIVFPTTQSDHCAHQRLSLSV